MGPGRALLQGPSGSTAAAVPREQTEKWQEDRLFVCFRLQYNKRVWRVWLWQYRRAKGNAALLRAGCRLRRSIGRAGPGLPAGSQLPAPAPQRLPGAAASRVCVTRSEALSKRTQKERGTPEKDEAIVNAGEG